MLVECLVAMVLLNATALVVASLTRAVAAGRERTTLTVRAWALAVRDIETATTLGSTCLAGTASGGDAQPQLTSTWTERTRGRTREHDAVVQLTRSPLAGATTSRLALTAAWYCP